MKRLGLGLGALGLAAIVAIGVFVYQRSNSAPDEFELTETTDEADDATAEQDGDDADTSEGDNEEATAASTAGLDGTWTVDEGSEAGYRVVEDLSGITDFEAVGRTRDVTGSIEIEGATVTDGEFSVLVGSISSDDRRRDTTFANDIMRTGQFPSATLVLTEPIELGALPETGGSVSTTATGELTIRDSTNRAPIEVAAQLLGDQIEIVASVDVLFSDYGIDNPTNAFVTVRDEGKVEVRLLLSRG